MEGRGADRIVLVKRLSLSCDRLLSHLQLACCPSHCALPGNGKDVLVHSLQGRGEKPLQLQGHHGEITALVFGAGQPLLLCSASADYVILWDMEHCYRRARQGVVADGTVIGTLLGKVVHLSFSCSEEQVSACSGTIVYILNSKREEVLAALPGHLAAVTAAEFCPWDPVCLVSTAEDRTFKVWDIEKGAVLYQSSVLSASPLLSAAFLEGSRQLVTGSADGQLWCFSFHEDHTCHLVSRLDLHRAQQRYLHTVGQHTGGVCVEQPDPVEVVRPVLRMSSLTCRSPEPSREGCWLWLGSSDALYLLDLATLEILTGLYLQDEPSLNITHTGSWSISQAGDNKMVCLVSSLFEPDVCVLEVRLPCSVDSLYALLDKDWSSGQTLSVLPSAPPIPDSPLNAELRRREPKQTQKKGLDKRAAREQQPLVFHSAVRSSGYAEAPRMTMFSPNTNVQKRSGLKKTSKETGGLFRDYPADTGPPSVLHTHLSTARSRTPVCCCQYSGDGKQVLCGLGDGSVLSYKSNLAREPSVYTGHDKAVSIVGWSHSRQWWLSASEDHTLRICPSGSPEPALIMAPDMFPKPIRGAQFYYLDRFLLLASGPGIFLYLLHLDATRDRVRRYQQRSVVQLTKRLETTSSCDITSLSAINDFYSYLVLVCGSDRSVQVLDMNQAAVASRLSDAHCRAAHHITQNQGSMFSSPTPDSYNLFLTSAVTDGLKLWDLRSLRCVRRYESHLNRRHPCAAAFSPCGRFLSSGSEDGCAYVYDLRHSSYLHKLQRQSDTVQTVNFNPAIPELLTGTLDGTLSLFRPSEGAPLS